MEIKIIQEDFSQLENYTEIPIRFTVKSRYVLEIIEGGLGGIKLHEEQLEKNYIKNYDEIESPLFWKEKFDLSKWSLWLSYEKKNLVGGAVFITNSQEIEMLGAREDVAVLWDMRVKPEYRQKGIGRKLFKKFEEWARKKECTQLKIETQNINVDACKFYVKNGCTLGGINRYAYKEFPDEIMLLWYKNLI